MNRKHGGVAQASRRPSMASTAGRAPAEISAALDTLVHGYRTESELYTRVRKLTWWQHDTLRAGWDLDRFSDLLEEKEDLMRMIGQIESVMKSAKSLVLSRKPSQCPDRWKLEKLLDQLAAMIEEIRIVEGANVSLLESAPIAG
jgi:hypothetical protein